jgi:hypothetical protein
MNIGLQDTVIDPKHAKRMGKSVWLFMWCVRCETPAKEGQPKGLVLGGMPLTYEEIATRSRFNVHAVRHWLTKLRKWGYITVRYLNYKMMRLIVNKSQKWCGKQASFTEKYPEYDRPKVVNRSPGTPTESGQWIRPKVVNRVTESARSKQRLSIRKNRTSDKNPPQVVSASNTRSSALTEHEAKTERQTLAWKRFVFCYPNKNSIDDQWTQHKFFLRHADDLIDEVIQGIEIWKQSEQWSEPMYIPLAQNFLDRRIWKIIPEIKRRKGNGNGISSEQLQRQLDKNIIGLGLDREEASGNSRVPASQSSQRPV